MLCHLAGPGTPGHLTDTLMTAQMLSAVIQNSVTLENTPKTGEKASQKLSFP